MPEEKRSIVRGMPLRTYCMSYTHHNFHTPNCESLADDLNTKRAVVSGRVVLLSRSTETQAWFWRFVPSRNNPPRQTPRLPFLSPSDSSSTTHTHTPSIGAARLALRSNVATVLRIPQHRTTIRRRTVSSRVFASHTQTTNTHAHTLARLRALLPGLGASRPRHGRRGSGSGCAAARRIREM
jgi:hypothetical protein